MDNAQRKDLLLKLAEGTKSRKYEWKEVADNIYRLGFENSSVMLINQTNQRVRDPDQYYLIQIYSGSGTLLEGLTANSFKSAGVDNAGQILAQLASTVKNQVLKIDETIQDLFKHL